MVATITRAPTKCKCSACEGLRGRYLNDPELLHMYEKKLLIPGWPGETDSIEKPYILAHARWAQVGAATLTKGRKRRIAPATDALPHDGCTCPACLALAAEYAIGTPHNQLNERMHQVVRRNLLVRGWAGGMTDVERDYVKAHPPKWYLQAARQGQSNLDRQAAEALQGVISAR